MKYKELIEIKMTSTFKTKMVETVKQFIDVKDKGYLLYNGESFQYSKDISLKYKNNLRARHVYEKARFKTVGTFVVETGFFKDHKSVLYG